MLSLTVHNCKAVRAAWFEGTSANWVDLTFVDGRGRDTEIAVFFQSAETGKRFASAVNSLGLRQFTDYPPEASDETRRD